MSRSAYTKLEAGQTTIGVKTLCRIAGILNVSARQLLSKLYGEEATANLTDIDFMLEMVYHHLSWNKLTFVPYDDLTAGQLAMLTAKGFTGREAYEDTPSGGRLYAYGPQQIVRLMLGSLHMATLFEQHLVQDASWLYHWQLDQQLQAADLALSVPDVDEAEYFVVFLIGLNMPDGTEQGVQLAQRNIPEGLSEHQALEKLISSTGALDGYIGACTVDGYAPFDEIITAL
jgi:hypothetical protein